MKKVDYKGLTPKVAKIVKQAYRIGLANGKAIATAGLRRQVELLREARTIDVELIATLKRQLAGEAPYRMPGRDVELTSAPMPIATLPPAEPATSEPHDDEPVIGECLVCEGHPESPNDPCIACGQMSVAEAERRGLEVTY